MREINLPYHYIYTQILDVGIENRQTHHMGPLKLTEYACFMVEAFYNMVDILFILIETDQIFQQKFNISLNCKTELISFGSKQQKGLVEDLLNLCIFLKEKGEPFKVLLLKLTHLYLSDDFGSEKAGANKVLDRVGTFAIDTVASKKLTQEFHTNYTILLSLQLLIEMVDCHGYSLTDKVQNLGTAEGISETGLERINSYNSLGWLTRFIHHRDTRIRFTTWNLLKSLVSLNLVKQHPTLIDESLECFLHENEVYGCKITSLNFISKVSELLLETESFMDDEDSDNEEEKPISMEYIIKCAGKHMFVSKLESILYQENVPAIFVCSLIRFIK